MKCKIKSSLSKKLFLSFPDNDKLFKRKRSLRRQLRILNKKTQYFTFSLNKVVKSKIGLRDAVLDSQTKPKVGFRLKVKVIIYENTKGEIRVGYSTGRNKEPRLGIFLKRLKQDLELIQRLFSTIS